MSERRIRRNRIKRNRELRRHIMLAVGTICMICILAITVGSSFSKAKASNKDTQVYKYFTSIMVQSGDNLSTIAAAHISSEYESVDSYISEIKHINSLDDDTIHAGQYLIVPYYTTEFLQ